MVDSRIRLEQGTNGALKRSWPLLSFQRQVLMELTACIRRVQGRMKISFVQFSPWFDRPSGLSLLIVMCRDHTQTHPTRYDFSGWFIGTSEILRIFLIKLLE
jgi:hypothetical protein